MVPSVKQVKTGMNLGIGMPLETGTDLDSHFPKKICSCVGFFLTKLYFLCQLRNIITKTKIKISIECGFFYRINIALCHNTHYVNNKHFRVVSYYLCEKNKVFPLI